MVASTGNLIDQGDACPIEVHPATDRMQEFERLLSRWVGYTALLAAFAMGLYLA